MFRTVFSLLGFLSGLRLHTQDGIAAGSEDRAAELRQLLRDTPPTLGTGTARVSAPEGGGSRNRLLPRRRPRGVIYVLALRNGGHQKTLVLGVPSQTPALF